MASFKFLYKDLKPDPKLSEIALEVFRRVPGVYSSEKIESLFKYDFNIERIIDDLRVYSLEDELIIGENRTVLEDQVNPIILGNHYTILDFVTGSEVVSENLIRKLEEMWKENRRKVVEFIYEKCDVFKVRENLFVVAVLIRFEGWSFYIVKKGRLASKFVFEDSEGKKIRWIQDSGKNIELKFRCPLTDFPDQIAIVDKLARKLICEIVNGRVLMCSFSVDAIEEAVNLISELKNDPSIWSIDIWRCEEVYDREYASPHTLDAFSDKNVRALQKRFDKVIAPDFDEEKPYNDPKNIEAFRRAGWAVRGCMGHVIVESNGFDSKAIYMNYMRLEKYREWRKKILEWCREYEIEKSRLSSLIYGSGIY